MKNVFRSFRIGVNKWKFNDSSLRDEDVMFGTDGKVIAKAAKEINSIKSPSPSDIREGSWER